MQHRITAIDIMQGIAMLLVVVGHHFFPFMPEWYRRLYYWVYTFHMPLFIFISGFLIRYSYKGVHGMAEYRSYVGRRFRKFALPYIIVGVLCALLAWNFGDVGITDNMLNLLIAPKLGEARFLWYLYLLFMFYCMAPLIFNAKNMIRWCIAGMAFYFSVFYVPSNYLCADYMTRYFVFFMFGVLVAESYIRIRKIPKRWYMVPAVVFVGMTVLHFQYGYNAILEYAMQWMGIPACACAAWGLEK